MRDKGLRKHNPAIADIVPIIKAVKNPVEAIFAALVISLHRAITIGILHIFLIQRPYQIASEQSTQSVSANIY